MSERNKKPNTRRLFSLDSLKSSRTASFDSSQYLHERKTTNLSQVDEIPHDDPFRDGAGGIDATIQLNDPDVKDQRLGHSQFPTTASTAQTSEQPSRTSTPDSSASTTSASRIRWDKIRQHVLLSSSSVTRQPTPQLGAPAVALSQPPRSTTPKPSRLARLGFRQAVEQAREAVEENHTFAIEIAKACWLSRYGEQSKAKSERDTIATTMGSTLYLPFVTNPSLSGPSMIPSAVSKRQDTVMTQTSSISSQYSIPTLKPLWQLLMTYATPAADGTPNSKTLPHETLILSILQGPFLRPGQQGWIQEERRFAMESFELLFKTWFPDNESSLLNYCQWCCVAALMPPGHLRLRALNGIYGLLGSRNTKLIWSPGAFRSLFADLLRLLALSSTNSLYVPDTDGMILIQDCLNLLRAGSCVAFDLNAVVECYGLAFSSDDEAVIRDLIAVESLAKCVETFTGPTRTWFIQYACNGGWISSHEEWSPGQWSTLLHVEKLGSFSRALARVLSPNEAGWDVSDGDVQSILQLLTTKILPEVEIIESTKATKIKQHIARIALRIIILDRFDVQKQWAASAISEWNHGATDWKKALESALQDLISEEVWATIFKTMNVLLQSIQDPTRQHIVAFVLPLLNQRIVEDPPSYPSPDLSSILSQLSQRYPPVFYKCLFSCAAASKDYTIIIHLCALTAINKFVPDFWLRDAEMLSIALINDIGKKTDAMPGKVKPARLGQLVVLVELIGQIQATRHKKEELSQPDNTLLETNKVAIQLESRLGVLLDAREKEAQYPFSHRVLYCILLRELRLLTRSSKPAPWLTLVVTWLIDYHNEHWGSEADSEELDNTFSRLQALYESARYGVQSSGNQRRRSTSVFSLSNFQPDTVEEGQTYGIFNTLTERLKVLDSARKGFAAKAMKLLVLMSTLITTEDYVRLGPIIWTHSFQESIPSSLNSACYLAMQCAEKMPQDFLATIEVDLKSSDDLTRLHALQKLSILCARRFELVLLPTITDRYHRAFKLARGPLSFIPTDMGSSSYIPEDNIDNSQHSLPLALMKQLAEIGWAQDDATADSRQAWLQIPMQLLPSNDLSRLETSASDSYKYPSSPSLTSQGSPTLANEGTMTPEQLILRRNSSSGGPSYSVKRKSVFVSPLGGVFLRIAVLIFDPNIVVASAAKSLVLDLMRNDPGLLSRPLFDLLSDDDKDISLAMSRMDLLIHAHWIVPPAAAHHMFNHLAGYLKTAARESKRPGVVEDFARTILPLVDLAPDVSGMSMRELRRSKLEYCFLPTGSFWFPKPSPNEHMLPTELSTSCNASGGVPPLIVSITLIRVCQNLMFTSMLRKNQQDVRFIRKHMSRFDLPTLNGNQRLSDLELRDFLLSEGHARKETINETLIALSTMLSRSYLLLVTQIFLSMPRHLSDRNELVVFVDGLNRILLAHGDDIGIVSQVLITLMVASTRFRRLFTSGGAYTLFMPAVLKAYADAGSHSGIRLAIEYTVGRFYAFHEEAFVFQSLDVFSRLAVIPEIAGEKLGKHVSDLFASLRRGLSPSTPDAAGIHDANKGQEQEALLLNAVEEKPQALLVSMKHGAFEDKNSPILNLPEEYQGTRFRIDDLVKLFLTIIAHDVSSLRAQNFLKLLGLVVPYIYLTSIGSRSVLQEGIDALSRILMKPSTKAKTTHPESENLLPPEKQSNEATRSDSDITRMRLDFLSLVISFTRAGGSVVQPTVPRTMDMIKTLLKDSDNFDGRLSAFLSDFTEALLLRDNLPAAKDITFYIRDLTSIISTYGAKLDFGRTFAVLAKLNNMPIYANDIMFFRVMKQVCEAGLATCALAGKDNSIISLPHRSNLVMLLSQAVTLHGLDIASEVEKYPPTYDYLAGIVLPLVMALTTDMTVSPAAPGLGSGNQILHLWIRLLQYTLTACQTNQRSLESDNNRKSMDKRTSTGSILFSQVSTFVIAMQVLKAILIRAGDELSFRLPGLWHRLASILKTLLADGNAEFALRAPELSLPSSPVATPLSSPRTSFQLDPLAFPATTRTEPHNASHFERGYLSPRIVDYALWSLFEHLCSYRTPLLLQMRHFIVEKVLDLDHTLQSQRSLHSPNSFSSSASGGRPVSISAFSKPFRRTSGLPSPVASPMLSPAQDSSHYSGYLTASEGRKPGYQYQSPVASYTSGAQDLKTGPRILHLGPVSASLLRPASISMDSTDGISHAAKTAKIKNLSLIRATYRRIRFTQTCMGYHNVLPLPYHESLDADADEVVPSSCTKYQALETIKAEVAQLLEEFGHHQNPHDSMKSAH
ncbi:hypothetical protein M378DRAFT_80770 [Amanita muscaria Koide BX008]|uniref:Protein UNC80 C-terminal domain-containing protein n=1 Tax=Amanita muscaria (strain Koide BX008) TaxID=946122 RepID=A0A0C2WMB4_AMAMK|nr:hypothetical protein M378DRAFT_80770 [Amanita muscaria Koide BX008]